MTLPRPLFAILGAIIFGVGCQTRESADRSAIIDERVLPVDSLRCVRTDETHRCDLYGVSMYELLVRPREWDGKRVRVIGFAHFHDEESQLFASGEDWRRNISANAVRLQAPAARLDSLNHRDVLVEATFDARASGGLQHVTRLESWEAMHRRRVEDIPAIDLKRPPD